MAVTMESALGTLVYPRPTYPSYSRFTQPGLWPKCPPEEDYNHYNASFYNSNGKSKRGNFSISPEWLSEDVSPAEFTRSKWKPWPYEYPGARGAYQHPNAQGWTVAEVKLGHGTNPNLAQPGYSPYKYVPLMHRDEIKDRWGWNEKQALLDPRVPVPPTYEEVVKQRHLRDAFGLYGALSTTQASYGRPGTTAQASYGNPATLTAQLPPSQVTRGSPAMTTQRPHTAPTRGPQTVGSLNIKIDPMPMRDVVKAGLDKPKTASHSLIPENFSSAENNPRENPMFRSAAEPLPTVRLPYPTGTGSTPYLTTHYPATFMAEFDKCKVRHMGNKYISGYMTKCDWG